MRTRLARVRGLVGQLVRIIGAQSHFTIYALGLTVHVPLESSGVHRQPGRRAENPGTARRKMRPAWSRLPAAVQ